MTATNAADLKTLSVECPAGKKAVAGGGTLVGVAGLGAPSLIASRPVEDAKWFTASREGAGYASNWALRAYAVCAVVS